MTNLSTIHAANIAHNDISCANILVDSTPHLIDWGSASGSWTSSGDSKFGTTPEESRKQLQQDKGIRKDVASLCATLFNIFTNQSATNLNNSNYRPKNDLRSAMKQMGVPQKYIKVILDGMHFEGQNQKIHNINNLSYRYFQKWKGNFIPYIFVGVVFAMIMYAVLLITGVITGPNGLTLSQNMTWSEIRNKAYINHIIQSPDWDITNFDFTEFIWEVDQEENSFVLSQKFCADAKTLHISDTKFNPSARSVNSAGIDGFRKINYDTEEILYRYYYDDTTRDEDNYVTEYTELKSSDKVLKLTAADLDNNIAKFFPRIETLVLENVEIPGDYDGFVNMKYLKNIILYNCNITTLYPFRNLEYITINNINTDSEVRGLEHLTNTQMLTINDSKVDLKGIEDMSKMMYLSLCDSAFNAEPLSLIPANRLEFLLLSDVSDDVISNIGKYTNLRYFYGDFSDYSDGKLDRLAEALKNNTFLQNVGLRSCQFDDMSALEQLADGNSIEGIYIHHAEHTDFPYWTDYSFMADGLESKFNYTIYGYGNFSDPALKIALQEVKSWQEGTGKSEIEKVTHTSWTMGYTRVAVAGSSIYFGEHLNEEVAGNFDFENSSRYSSVGENEKRIYDPSFLTMRFPNVEYLELYDCNIPLDCEEFKNLKNLSSITICNYEINDLSWIADTNIRSLTLKNCSYIDLSQLVGTKVRYLTIDNCSVDFTGLSEKPLYNIHLQNMSISAKKLRIILDVPGLPILRFVDCDIEDIDFLEEYIKNNSEGQIISIEDYFDVTNSDEEVRE